MLFIFYNKVFCCLVLTIPLGNTNKVCMYVCMFNIHFHSVLCKEALACLLYWCITSNFKYSYFIRIINDWNSLPNDIKESVSISGFKHTVISFLGNS